MLFAKRIIFTYIANNFISPIVHRQTSFISEYSLFFYLFFKYFIIFFIIINRKIVQTHFIVFAKFIKKNWPIVVSHQTLQNVLEVALGTLYLHAVVKRSGTEGWSGVSSDLGITMSRHGCPMSRAITGGRTCGPIGVINLIAVGISVNLIVSLMPDCFWLLSIIKMNCVRWISKI